MNNELSIIEKKQASWSGFAVIMHDTEMQLQVMAQKAINDISYPAEISDIPNAEECLKSIKKQSTEVQDLRKTITDKFRDVTNRLMIPEKSFEEPIAKLTSAIISLKKQHESIQNKEANINREKASVKEAIIKHCIELDEKLKLYINELIDMAFVFALSNDIAIINVNSKVDEWSELGIKKILEYKFEPFKIKRIFISQTDMEELILKNFTINLVDYANTFDWSIKEKFKDYEVAFLNIKDALKRNEIEKAEAKKAIAAQKLNSQIAASIENAGTVLNATPTIETKELKKVYQVDMPETFESAMMILSAFIANKDKALKKTTTKKWFAFNASSASTALEKIKNDDNSFAPSGINFKEVEKL